MVLLYLCELSQYTKEKSYFLSVKRQTCQRSFILFFILQLKAIIHKAGYNNYW